MRPRTVLVPQGTFALHAKCLQTRLQARCSRRSASSDTMALWRGKDPVTKLGQSVMGTMEWQTSMYSFNKQNSKTLPVAATNVEKLIQGYVTMADIDTSSKDARAIRNIINTRRKSEFRIYTSKPRVKDYGDRIEMKVFTYNNKPVAKGRFPSSQSSTSSTASSLDIASPQLRVGLESLLSRIYSKPVNLTLVPLAHAHLDADILASLLAQRLKDRRNSPSIVTRDAAWKPRLPDAETVTEIQRKKLLDTTRRSSMSWRDMTLGAVGGGARETGTSALKIMEDLGLSRVTSIQARAGGRLTKRMTANRAEGKMARNGATAKGPGVDVLGYRKRHLRVGFASGKRRVGQFGIKVRLGHS